MQKWTSVIPYFLLVIFLGIFVVFGLSFRNDKARIFIPNMQPLTEFVYQGEEIEHFPSEVDVMPNNLYQISVVLPEDFNAAQTILFRTSLQDIFVYLDGHLIYQKDYQNEENYASMWHFVDIGGDSEGKELMVAYRSPFEAMSGVINSVSYGDEGSLIKGIFFQYGYRLVIGLLTVFVGLSLMIASLFVYRKQSKANMYLGLFAVVIGTWMISESRMMQLFTGNVFVIGSISYIALAFLPIPLFAYLLFYVRKKFHWYFLVMIGVFFVLTPGVIMLDLINLVDYFESAIFTQILLFISMVVSIIILIIEKVKYQNSSINEVINYLLVFSLFGLLELITFVRSDFDHTSYFMIIGVAIVMGMISYNYIMFLVERFKISYENEFYEFLAYHDPITGANNRLAYEQDFDRLFEDEALLSSLRLLYFDLDNLKHINDVYGHLEGDGVIKEGHDIIKQTFGEYGTVYRIGGDEFACLVTSLDQTSYERLTLAFEELVNKTNQDKEYHFGLSIGSSIYDKNDKVPEDLVERADQLMYEYKNNTKKEHDEGSK